MIKLTQTGVGTVSHPYSLRDDQGTALLPVQGKVTGSATFRLLGRVSPDADWLEIRAANTVAFLESFSWVPFIQLEITSGSGTVTLWIGDK
jgi:hypothetical protein